MSHLSSTGIVHNLLLPCLPQKAKMCFGRKKRVEEIMWTCVEDL